MAIPTFFSVLVWMISVFHVSLHESFQPDLPRMAWLLGSTRSDKNTMMSLVPRNVADSFQLGRISAQLEVADKDRKQDAARLLLDEARLILQSPVPLTFEEATNGVAAAAKYKVMQGSPLRRVLGMLSFVRILSFITLMAMVATLFPALRLTWTIIPQQVKDDILYAWSILVSMAKSCKFLVEPALYLIPIFCFETALLFPEGGGGAGGQVAALAALLSFAPYYYSVRTHTGSLDQLGRHGKYITTLTCVWAASFLAPMAWATSSKFLGFFTMGAVFGTLGFVAVPSPFGWAAGFLDEASMNRSMFASVIIIMTFLGSRALGVASTALSTFETGAAIFGMLAFGIAGLIKSAKASGDDWDYGEILRAKSLLYPISWLILGYFGSVLSYTSLTNISTTFVVLWLSQFYWRIVGFNAVGVFFASAIMYATTLWLLMRPDFVASLFKL
jgi:hypothetical protein